MQFLPLIEAKRDGKELTDAQLQDIISAYTDRRIPDYQMAAFLMAVYFRGLTTEETTALTLAMRDSGDRLVFPVDMRPLADKHSTGGVGDKVSLALAPLLACLGIRVPMISGRGLGITGGTLDKLESIPGFQTSLPGKRIIEIVQSVGCVICGQTERMVPADKALYSLRDVTGTVPSIPLIVASILSKKLAENLDALVLDVKFGAAAFMPTFEKARELGQAMVALGNGCGVSTRALVTRMEAPLGRSAGNWLEVKEAVACLSPALMTTPPSVHPRDTQNAERLIAAAPQSLGSPIADLLDLVLTCASHLLVQSGKAKSIADARRESENCLASGAPLKKWEEMLRAQGADLDGYQRKFLLDHTAPEIRELTSTQAGYVSNCDARLIAEVIRDLGGGRLTKESVINSDVGVDRIAKPGDKLEPGDVLVRVHAATPAQAEDALRRLRAAFEISPLLPPRPELIAEVL